MIVSRVHPKRGVQYVRRIVFRSRYKNYRPLVLWHADQALALDIPDAEAAELVAWLKRSSQYPFVIEVTT